MIGGVDISALVDEGHGTIEVTLDAGYMQWGLPTLVTTLKSATGGGLLHCVCACVRACVCVCGCV